MSSLISFTGNLVKMKTKLNTLLSKRTNENKNEIDAEIWRLYGEKRAIVFVDLTKFTRKTKKFGIIASLSVINKINEMVKSMSKRHKGTLVKFLGDGCLVTFHEVDDAIRFSDSMMSESKKQNTKISIGIGFGEVIELEGLDIFGAEVNHTFAVEKIAVPMQIIITKLAYESTSMKDKFKQKGDHFIAI